MTQQHNHEKTLTKLFRDRKNLWGDFVRGIINFSFVY